MTSLGTAGNDGDGNDSDPSLSTDLDVDEGPQDDEPCGPDLSTSVEEKQNTRSKTQPKTKAQPKKRRKRKNADDESDTDASEERNVTKGWDTSLDSEAIMRMSRLAEREAALTC